MPDEKPIKLTIVDDDTTLTESELKDLKTLVSNYRAAKIGVTALVGLGAFITAVMHLFQWINGKGGS